VVTFLLELQETTGARVEITMRPNGSPGRPALEIEAQALALDTNQRVVRVLGSARVRLPGNNFGGIEAALYSLGYELDKDVYRKSEGLQPPLR